MALFDSPNDLQWNGQIDTFKRSSNEKYFARVLDERGDGNYMDNMFQKYTVELLGWGQKLYNVKPQISKAGYNGTGEYITLKVNDIVLLEAKEGQLDEALIVGSTRLNGNYQKLEVEGQGQKPGEHYQGPRQRTAASNPPAVHPARACKVDSNFYLGGVNNARTTYEDPTELGTLDDSLDKQPIPGVIKYTTSEGVDVNYSYGGILHMTDGNLVVLSSGSRQNKCTKYLEQAERHAKIATHLNKLGTFSQTNITTANQLQDPTEDPEVDLEQPLGDESGINITEDTPLFSTSEGRAASIPTEQDQDSPEAQSRSGGQTPEQRLTDADTDLEDVEGIFGDFEDRLRRVGRYGMAILSGATFRARKHQELADIAKTQAEQCNATGAAYQYSSLLMGNNTGRPSVSTGGTSPTQGIGNVDPNNFSSRNGGDPKPPTVSKPAHPTNYANRNHSIKYLVMHHSVSTEAGMTRDFQTPKYYASAHYAVDRDGTVIQYVPDNKVAYHVKSQNTGKVGIEIVATKPGHGMTTEQEESLVKLARYIVSTYNIPLSNVRGHNEFMSTQCPTWVFPTAQSLKDWVQRYLSDLS